MRCCIRVVVLVVLATAGTAFGESLGTVDMTVGLPGNNQTATFSWSPGEEVYVGPYQYTLSNPTTSAVSSLLGSNPLVVNGFCVDYTTNIYLATNYKTDVYALGDKGTLHNLPVGSSIDSIVPHIEEAHITDTIMPVAHPLLQRLVAWEPHCSMLCGRLLMPLPPRPITSGTT